MTGGAAVKLPDMAYELMETGYHAMLNYQHRDWGKGFSIVSLQIEPKHLSINFKYLSCPDLQSSPKC